MSQKRNHQDYFQRAMLYDFLSKYYKYIDPVMHVRYYQKHLKYMNKGVQSMRSDMMHNIVGSPQSARVRVIHASPDAPNVDVYVNGNRILQDVPYKQVSNYMSLPAGRYQVDVYPTGDMVSTVISRKVDVEPGKSYILVAGGTLDKIRLLTFENQPQVPSGETKVRFIHLSPDAPAVDIAVPKGDVVFPNVSFRQATNYLGLSPMTVDLEARVAGTKNVALSLPKLQLLPNTTYSILAIGLVSGEPELEALVISD